MQSIIRALYPSQCVACSELTENENGLCGACWPGVHFIDGTQCDKCGAPLLGQGDDTMVHCDDCLRTARPWDKGRSALLYKDVGRRLVLGLKHGDRSDYVPALSKWMAAAGRALYANNSLLVPVPLHRFRLFRRKFNQAAELAKGISKQTGLDVGSDVLDRHKATASLDRKTKEERFQILQDAICANPARRTQIEGRSIILVDDVITTGATLAACAEACVRSGAKNVSVLVLARVVKDT